MAWFQRGMFKPKLQPAKLYWLLVGVPSDSYLQVSNFLVSHLFTRLLKTRPIKIFRKSLIVDEKENVFFLRVLEGRFLGKSAFHFIQKSFIAGRDSVPGMELDLSRHQARSPDCRLVPRNSSPGECEWRTILERIQDEWISACGRLPEVPSRQNVHLSQVCRSDLLAPGLRGAAFPRTDLRLRSGDIRLWSHFAHPSHCMFWKNIIKEIFLFQSFTKWNLYSITQNFPVHLFHITFL